VERLRPDDRLCPPARHTTVSSSGVVRQRSVDAGSDEGPRAVVVLRRDGKDVLLGPVYAPGRCDLGFVEDLLRVHLAARRFGWSIVLRNVRRDLLELVELVGLTTELVAPGD
jgi:hypothetical protein